MTSSYLYLYSISIHQSYLSIYLSIHINQNLILFAVEGPFGGVLLLLIMNLLLVLALDLISV
jgi:hypothetical protein